MIQDIRKLLQVVENGTREDIWEAAKSLSSLGNETTLILLSLLKTAKEPEARAASAYVLGLGRYGSARIALEETVANESEDMNVRSHAAEALAYIGDPRSAQVLMRHMNNEEPSIKYWCTFALGQTGESKHIEALRQMADSVGETTYDRRSLRDEALQAVAEIESRMTQTGSKVDEV